MFKYTPAKHIMKQLSKINRNPMSTTKKFELAKTLLDNDQWVFVEYYEKFSAFYSSTKVTHVPIMSGMLSVNLFDMEEV